MTNKIDFGNSAIKILLGDATETLKELPEKSVNCCVTSPPYFAQRSYLDDNDENKEFEIGREETPNEYINRLVEVFRQVKRVLRDDGVCFINIADTYCGTGNKGDFTDPKYPDGRNGQKIANNNKIEGIKQKDLIGIPYMLAFAMREDGWYWRDNIIWAKACSGVYSGGSVMPESVVDRTVRSFEHILMFTKSSKYFYDHKAIAEKQKDISLRRAYSNNNMEARKAKGDEQYAISGKSQDKTYSRLREKIESGEIITRNRRNVWTVNIRPSSVSHFASYPSELIEPCILAGTSEKGRCCECGAPVVRVVKAVGVTEHGSERKRVDASGTVLSQNTVFRTENMTMQNTVGWERTCKCDSGIEPCIVLDPFGGTGTTVITAELLGRRGIYCELNSKYISCIDKRKQEIYRQRAGEGKIIVNGKIATPKKLF